MSDATYTERDRRYIQSHFRRLDDLVRSYGLDLETVRAAIAEEALPRPSYHVDGTDWVPEDFLERGLKDGLDPSRVRTRFLDDYAAAYEARYGRSPDPEKARQAWRDYLTGAYGVCLRHATPEGIVTKGYLITAIEELLATPRPEEEHWRTALAEAVAALDALERPFAAGDRERFGGLVSRDIYVTAVRRLFASILPPLPMRTPTPTEPTLPPGEKG